MPLLLIAGPRIVGRSDEAYGRLGSVAKRTALNPLRHIRVGNGYVWIGGEAPCGSTPSTPRASVPIARGR